MHGAIARFCGFFPHSRRKAGTISIGHGEKSSYFSLLSPICSKGIFALSQLLVFHILEIQSNYIIFEHTNQFDDVLVRISLFQMRELIKVQAN